MNCVLLNHEVYENLLQQQKKIQVPSSFTVAVIKSEQYDKHWVNSEAPKLAGKEIFLCILHVSDTFRICPFFLSSTSIQFSSQNSTQILFEL
jgi:hypothetical protein